MNDPYRCYMVLDVVNSDYNLTSEPQLKFEETRNTPFLPSDSADYFCSIVLFSTKSISEAIYEIAIIFDWVVESSASPFPPFGDAGADMIGLANVMYEPEDATAQTPAKPPSSHAWRAKLSKQRGLA